ncbi:hypothetical protein D1872_90020 [compost metagenome]
MAKIDQGMLKNWQDGQTIHAVEYNNERNLIVAAYNDTQAQVDVLKGNGSISTGMLQDKSVTTAKLADLGVTTIKIAPSAVTRDKIAGLAVNGPLIDDNSIDTRHIVINAVKTAHLTDYAVTSMKLAEGSVITAKLADGSVTTAKIAGGAVETAKIKDLAVTTGKINDGAVTNAKIGPGAVTSDKLASGTIVSTNLGSGAVTTDKLAGAAVTTDKIANGNVNTDKLADLSVTSAKLAEGAVTPTKLTKPAVTQYTYDKEEIDSRIASAVVGGIPQDVIDEIKQDIFSTKDYNRLPDDYRTDPRLGPDNYLVGMTYFETKFPNISHLVDYLNQDAQYLVKTICSDSLAVQLWYVVKGFDLQKWENNIEQVVENKTFVRYSTGLTTWAPFEPDGTAAIQEYFRPVEDTRVTLRPGTNVFRSTIVKDSRFKIEPIKGFTMVNHTPIVGYCETLNDWNVMGGSLALTSAQKVIGNNSMLFTPTDVNTAEAYFEYFMPAYPSTQYLVIAKLLYDSADTDGRAALRLIESSQDTVLRDSWLAYYDGNMAGKGWHTIMGYVKTLDTTDRLWIRINAQTNNPIYFDALAVYRIDDTMYHAVNPYQSYMDTTSPGYANAEASLNALLPSPGTTGIIGVEDPYMIARSINMLPPFHEWTIFSHASVVSPYVYKQVYTNGNWSYGEIEVAPNTDYYLSFKSPNGVKIGVFQAGDSGTVIAWHSSTPFSFNSGNNSRIRLVIAGDIAGVIENPMLVVGKTAQPFQPQRKSMLALQTGAYAGVSSGASPDVIFERDGQYFKTKNWNKLVLDGSLNWEYFDAPSTTYKRLTVKGILLGMSSDAAGVMLRYNGDLVPGAYIDGWGAKPFQWGWRTAASGDLLISIPNNESGWGHTYTPTQDEIKAYFWGWRMCNQADAQVYQGTGTKCWGRITEPANVIGSGGWLAFTNLPTASAWRDSSGREFTPFQVLFALKTPVTEHIPAEGGLMLSDGYNAVEVGTGLVLRERSEVYGLYINAVNAGYGLKYETTDIRAVYKNNMPDNNWTFHTNSHNGALYAYAQNPNVDRAAIYSVTYLKAKTSMVPAFIWGGTNANERGQIDDLEVAVSELGQRVSVVEMKKLDEDAPGWITPTLLNGWVPILNFGVRVKDNKLEFRGGIQRSSPVLGDLMVLPQEMRVKTPKSLALGSFDPSTTGATAVLDVFTDGRYTAIVLTHKAILFEGLTIPLD